MERRICRPGKCESRIKAARINSVGQIALEPVQRALGGLRGPRQGARTCNAARQAAIQFERYLLRTNKVRHTVLQDLARFNEAEDVRRKRRPLTEEEVQWLLATTAAGEDRTSRRCGIAPADRAMLYATGIGTGFRRRGLLGLERSAFFVDPKADRRFVRLSATFNKNGRDRDQPVPTDLADRLHEWLSRQPESGPVWRPSPHADLSLWFRRDMAAARAAWIAAAADATDRERRERSDTLKYVYHDGVRNVFADFHGLRHTGITFVVRRAGLRVGQEWADHSTPALTARYAAVDESDMIQAMEGLPALGPAATP